MTHATPDHELLTVQVRLYDGTRKAEVDLDPAVRVHEVIAMARERWQLDGPRDFRLVHTARVASANGSAVESDVELDSDAALIDCCLQPGAVLTIYPILVAGAAGGAGSAFAAVRARRLAAEATALDALERGSPGVLRVVAREGGAPPARYVIELNCPAVTSFESGRARTGHGPHRVEIAYPALFPRPKTTADVRFLTPVRHVHVFSDGKVCLGAISGPDEPLDALVARLLALLQYDPDLIDLSSPANAALISWTRANRARFPLGQVQLGRAEAADAAAARPRLAWTDLL